MVLLEEDYRFCVNMSLQILQEQRRKLYEDSVGLNHILRMGLHKSGKFEQNVQDLYFQKYNVEWLDAHWEKMNQILENHNEYSQTQKKDITLFFVNYFWELFTICCQSDSFSNLIVPELLTTKRQTIDNLLKYAQKWQEKSNLLRADIVKHQEQYQNLLDEAEKRLL